VDVYLGLPIFFSSASGGPVGLKTTLENDTESLIFLKFVIFMTKYTFAGYTCTCTKKSHTFMDVEIRKLCCKAYVFLLCQVFQCLKVINYLHLDQ
jgi:hypothetical protein